MDRAASISNLVKLQLGVTMSAEVNLVARQRRGWWKCGASVMIDEPTAVLGLGWWQVVSAAEKRAAEMASAMAEAAAVMVLAAAVAVVLAVGSAAARWDETAAKVWVEAAADPVFVVP